MKTFFNILAFPYSIFTKGIITMLFWQWFLVPVFPEIPLITFLQAIGLTFFFVILRAGGRDLKKKYYDESEEQTIKSFLNPVLLLGIGYFFKLIFL